MDRKIHIGILTYEDKVPIHQDVQTACEMLGLDPLEIGNEGKLIIGVIPEKQRKP
jgi:hydrogenase expression/formation protein HypE